MQNVHSLQTIPSRTSVNLGQFQYPITYPQSVFAVRGPREAVQFVTRRAGEALTQKCICSTWTSRSGSICYTTSRRSSECSARNGSTCSTPSTRRTSSCHSSTRSGCETKTLSILWKEIVKHTITTCRCKFGESNMKHMRDFPRGKGHCFVRFSQEANPALDIQRADLVVEVTSQVWRRDEQVHDLRTELGLQALHSEDVTQQ